MGETVERFPLFPLGIVLLPSEVVPLHIFEERYKLMIGEDYPAPIVDRREARAEAIERYRAAGSAA